MIIKRLYGIVTLAYLHYITGMTRCATMLFDVFTREPASSARARKTGGLKNGKKIGGVGGEERKNAATAAGDAEDRGKIPRRDDFAAPPFFLYAARTVARARGKITGDPLDELPLYAARLGARYDARFF